MSSSDDDIPLFQRNNDLLKSKAKTVLDDSDKEESELPSWLVNHKSPVKGDVPLPQISSESDDDVKEVLSPVKLLSPSKQQPTKLEDEDTPGLSQKPPSTKNKSPAKTATANKQPSQPTTAKSSQQPPAIKSLLPTSASSIPVMFPDKISQVKMLVELESTGEVHGATDLSGDSGAIGRFVIKPGSNGAPNQMQLDLKGILYNATIVEAPMSMAIVNIGATDAKVECVVNEFVQLREDAVFAERHRGAMLDDLFMEDEDATYVGTGAEDEDNAAGGGGSKKNKKAGGGAGKGKAAAKPKAARKAPAKKATKKPATKKGASQKPRAKPKGK